jgi:N-acetylglucosamine-6-phosphate deacetylase
VKPLLLENAQLIDPEAAAPLRGSLLVDGGLISARLPAGADAPRDAVRIDLSGRQLAPGFIDLHCHGELVFAEPGELGGLLTRAALDAPRHGTTAFLPTTVAWSPARLRDFVTRFVASLTQLEPTGAHVLGLHLEGPWINPAAAGAQPARGIRPFDPGEASEVFARSEQQLRMVTLAPELPGSSRLLDMVTRCGAVAALGHSLAGEEALDAAVQDGMTHVTHLFNGMAALHHREPGPAGLALTDDRLSCDLICDGAHVHPRMVRLAARAKGDGLMLITDRVELPAEPRSGAPGPAGPRSVSFGSGAVSDDGRALRLADGRLAGSSLTLDRAARNARVFGALDPVQVVAACSLRPARLLGLEAERGSLRPGARADLVVLGSEGQVLETWIAGRRVYAAPTG